MKLRTYEKNSKYLPGWYIRFYPSNGVIVFSPDMVEALKIRPGHTVSFHQNTEKPEEWFIEFGSVAGYSIYKVDFYLVGVSNKAILHALLGSAGAKKQTGLMHVKEKPVSVDGKTLYQIITSTPTYKT